MAIPKKLKISQFYKKITDMVVLRLPLPRTNPNMVSMLTVVLSLFALISLGANRWLFFTFAALSLLLDGLDGPIARRYNLSSEEGYMCDLLCDRLSEGILFVNFFMPWFILFAANLLLSIISISKRRHLSLPLRLLFLIYLLIAWI